MARVIMPLWGLGVKGFVGLNGPNKFASNTV